METMIHPLRTLMEVFDLLPEGTLAELIDNRLYISNPPLLNHQRTVKSIAKQLDKLVEETGKGY